MTHHVPPFKCCGSMFTWPSDLATLWKLITDLNRPFIFAGEDGLHIVRHLKNDGFNQLQWNSFRNIMGVSWKNDWMYRHVRGTSLDNEIYPVVIQQFTEKSPVNHRTKSVMTRIANDFFYQSITGA